MVQATTAAQVGPSSGVGRWAIVGVALFPTAYVASILALATIEQLALDPAGVRAEAGELSFSIRNGIHHVVWGAAVAAASIPLGRRLVPGIHFSIAGAAILAAGLLLGGAAELLINEFDRLRSGYFDPDHVGFVLAAPPALVGVALAAWAAMAVPRLARGRLVMLAVVAAVGFFLAVLPSIGGLADGIDPESLPLAAALVAGGGYVVIAPLLARR